MNASLVQNKETQSHGNKSDKTVQINHVLEHLILLLYTMAKHTFLEDKMMKTIN